MTLAQRLGMARSLAVYYGIPFRQRAMRRLYADLVPAGGLCFDIGAHVGNRLRCFRALGARVVALEPQADFAALLRRLYGRDPGVTLLEAAVGASAGEATLYASARTPTVSTLNAAWVSRAASTPGFEHVTWSEQRTVPVTTLDQLIAAHGLPDFIKIDVEGLEPQVLAGLSQPVPALSVEYLPALAGESLACVDRLAVLGDYRYNWSEGERNRFGETTWMTPDAARRWLAARPAGSRSGDLYARQRA